ncbi:CrcB family protein [Nicoliella spurrieriana]|uniref:Fluoride-specific ion channel FluC n=1 Tax=Nicoliella spurrieriana TaxID=2925830 RepID=A0A976RSV8_9LACO|nr:CrcB family protein [Nicoliella spurrieriana]UQS87205.1 CrcB family protein [Nicoliella spurrieriana]
MRRIIYIICFGFLGGALREWLTLLSGNQHFAMIIAINLIGTFLLSFIASTLPLLMNISSDVLSGITVGFIGSFTTFSTFTVDFVKLLKISLINSFWYLSISLIFGYIFALIGVKLADYVIAKAGEK